MGWRFRKTFNFGFFRAVLTKGGWGHSWGIPGFRIGRSPNGRKYISVGIPGTGLYYFKYLDEAKACDNHDRESPPAPTTDGRTSFPPWWKQTGLD